MIAGFVKRKGADAKAGAVMMLFRIVSDLVEGFLALPRGASFLLSNRKLWPYAILPLVINIFIILALCGLMITFFPQIRSLVWDEPESWFWSVLWYGFNLLLVLLLIVLLLILFVLLMGIIGGPFNGKLALRTREHLRGERLDPAGGIYVDLLMPVVNELKKFVYFSLLQIGLLFLNLIPAVGSIAYLILGGYFTFMFLAYAFLEYSIETESYVLSLKQRFEYLRRFRWSAIGFGAAVSIFFFIPLVDLFLAPIAVVGAALLYEKNRGRTILSL